MRVVKEFDEVELYWLLNGKGNFPDKSIVRLTRLLPRRFQKQSPPTALLLLRTKKKLNVSLFSTVMAVSKSYLP